MNSATIAESPACPNASAASGSPMLPQLLNIIGGTNVRWSSCSSLRERPREQARAQHDADAAQDQQLVRGEVEILARQRGEDERRREHVHVDPVDPRHVRPAPGARKPKPSAMIEEHRQDDAEDALEHGPPARGHASLEDVPRDVVVAGDAGETRVDVRGVDRRWSRRSSFAAWYETSSSSRSITV